MILSPIFLVILSSTPSSCFTSKTNFLVKSSSCFTCNDNEIRRKSSLKLSSDWSDFAYIDDDDFETDDSSIYFASENDPQEVKAEVGEMLPAPTIENDAEPIFVPQGSVLPLTMENLLGVLAACRVEIGTMFGYTAENRGVGITGGVDFVDLDGPIVILALKGRFWHQRPTVLARVGAYIMGRIPEVVDVIVEDEETLSDEVNNAAA